MSAATVTLCAFCNRPATTWHTPPPPVKGRLMPSIPLCGTKCNAKTSRKRREA